MIETNNNNNNTYPNRSNNPSTNKPVRDINIFQSVDIKLRNSSNNDRSRIQRTINAQNIDINTLKKNYSKRLYDIFHSHWKNKLLIQDRNNYDDNTIVTYLLNRYIALARQTEFQYQQHQQQKKVSSKVLIQKEYIEFDLSSIPCI